MGFIVVEALLQPDCSPAIEHVLCSIKRSQYMVKITNDKKFWLKICENPYCN